jgi:hypothetical protein
MEIEVTWGTEDKEGGIGLGWSFDDAGDVQFWAKPPTAVEQEPKAPQNDGAMF